MSRTLDLTWVDRVLDNLIEGGPVLGQIRKTHKRGWIGALQALTERIISQEMDDVGNLSAFHSEYRQVAASVVYLESLGLIRVFRESHHDSIQGNMVHRIEVVE